jgi:hypothetical protein
MPMAATAIAAAASPVAASLWPHLNVLRIDPSPGVAVDIRANALGRARLQFNLTGARCPESAWSRSEPELSAVMATWDQNLGPGLGTTRIFAQLS